MQEIKRLADPQGILNKGVILNSDPDAHLQSVKEMTLFSEDLHYKKADTCIECGFCEHVCPSRYVTLTPRQRLQARRIIARTGNPQLEKEYDYIGEQTCAADGMCQMPCPMGISTAVVTDAIRSKKATKTASDILHYAAGHFGAVETDLRAMLKLAVGTERVVSPYPLIWATDFLHRMFRQMPHWSAHFPMPRKLHYREETDPDYIYFPACVTRIFGASALHKDDLMTVILRIAGKAGVRVSLPAEAEGQKITANRTVACFYDWSERGRIPIFCDTTSCTHTLLSETGGNILTPENQEKYKQLKIIDITQWLNEIILPKIKEIKPKNRVLLHPTCSCQIMNLTPVMLNIARKCAREVILPDNWGCCGASGDRGFIFPELSESATRDERYEISDQQFDGCYSLARTCEIVMQDHIKQPYESIVYLVDETIG